MKAIKSKISPIKFIAAMLFVVFGIFMLVAPSTNSSSASHTQCLQSATSNNIQNGCKGQSIALTYGQCGNGSNAVVTSISFGCSYDHCVSSNGSADASQTPSPDNCSSAGNQSALIDIIFAIIRFLSDGVGLVVVASIVVGGIQYIASRGEPNSTSQAIARIRSSLVALIVFIFAYAILNYLIPIGFFKQ